MARTDPTDPVKRGSSVRSGFSPGGSKRGKAGYRVTGDPGDYVGGPQPVPAPQARPRPQRAPQRVVPKPQGRVDPSPHGRVSPPATNAHPAALYQAPGLSEGYGAGGYAPAPQMDVQAAYSPLLMALMAAMRGGYA